MTSLRERGNRAGKTLSGRGGGWKGGVTGSDVTNMADSVPAASGSDGADGAELRCALAAAWHVMRARRVREFHHVVDVVDSLRDVPRSFKARTWTRLRMGLRAAVVMQMLRDGQSGDVISDAMRRYFPPGSSQKEQPDVAEAQEHFVRLVSELVQNPRKRKWYLQRWAPHTYGRKLVTNLKSLLFELLLRIDSALPPPDLDKMQALIRSHAPGHAPYVDLPILRQYLVDIGYPEFATGPLPLRDDVSDVSVLELRPSGLVLVDPDLQRAQDGDRAQGQGGSDQAADEGAPPPPPAPPPRPQSHVMGRGSGPANQPWGRGSGPANQPWGRGSGPANQRRGRGLELDQSELCPLIHLRQLRHAPFGPRPLPQPRPVNVVRGDVRDQDDAWPGWEFGPDPDLLMDADRQRDRNRYRANRQGGAHQGAGGREGGDPPPAAAAHL